MVERRRAAAEARLDRTFAALSDPTRRRLIALLRDAGELRVTDLASAFDMSLAAVSKHIKVLERAELVARRVDGRTHWLRVEWSALQAPYEWLHHYHHFWSERLDALVDYVAERRPKRAAATTRREKGKKQR